MSETKFNGTDFEKIADDILCGVDYDIYKDDCNDMDNELRDEIESKLIKEFGFFDEMYDYLDGLHQSISLNGGALTIDEDDCEYIGNLLAKARGETA